MPKLMRLNHVNTHISNVTVIDCGIIVLKTKASYFPAISNLDQNYCFVGINIKRSKKSKKMYLIENAGSKVGRDTSTYLAT